MHRVHYVIFNLSTDATLQLVTIELVIYCIMQQALVEQRVSNAAKTTKTEQDTRKEDIRILTGALLEL